MYPARLDSGEIVTLDHVSILARDSPRHLLLPIPKGIFLSSARYLPLMSRNLSGLKTVRSFQYCSSMWTGGAGIEMCN